MGQILGLKSVLIFSAIVSIIFVSGFLINEASAGVPQCNGKDATIIGTEGRDKIRGTNGDDVIVTFGGHDRIWARGGDDTICSGPGTDVIIAGYGMDWIDAGPGFDFIFAGSGNDQVFARDGGKDVISCGSGNDFAQVDEREARIWRCETVDEPYIAQNNDDHDDSNDVSHDDS